MNRSILFLSAGAIAASLASTASGQQTPSASELQERFGSGVKIAGVKPVVPTGDGMVVRRGSFAGDPRGTCPEEQFQNFTDTGSFVSVPGFIIDEQAGAIFDPPAEDFPLEVLRVGIGWASPGGGQPDQLQDAIRIYPNGLPNPGMPQFEVLGPVLQDGGINEFDLTLGQGTGNRTINSGPFTVTLRFLTPSKVGGPAPLHDGNGCQPGKNVIFASPGFWADACSLGVSGDWAFYVVYRPLDCSAPPTDCNNNGVDDADEIDAFPQLDCDENGVLDTCEIADDPSLDCDGNNRLDVCDIADDPSLDCDGDGALDSCQIAADPSLDLNENGILDSCEDPAECVADLTGNGVVNSADLAELLGAWGACP